MNDKAVYKTAPATPGLLIMGLFVTYPPKKVDLIADMEKTSSMNYAEFNFFKFSVKLKKKNG